MGLQYLFGNYYKGMELIFTADGVPSIRAPFKLEKGTVGTLLNYDPWDGTVLVKVFGGFGSLISPSLRECWFKREYFEPYRPEKRNDDGKRVCARCGEPVDDSEEMRWIDGVGWACESCLENYSVCPVCGHLVPKDELISIRRSAESGRVEEALVCKSCLEQDSRYFRCPDCNEWFDENVEYYTSTRNGRVCEHCSLNYVECAACGNGVRIDDSQTVNGYTLCENCAEREKRKAIHNYGYKPAPKFKVGSTHDQFDTDVNIKELLMGVELEIDKGDDDAGCANEIVNTVQDVYCKHDGSLDRGVEIVSHPCTLQYHLTTLGWDKISEIARKYNFSSHNAKTCGLHVHVGRRQLENETGEETTAAKLVLATVRHWDNMVKFSRRLSSQLNWAECNKPWLDEAYTEGELIRAALDTESDGRYQAVNLCNENTVEFRIFRGTLEVNTIKATLEFVSNMCLYCKEHTAFEVMNSQWEDIAYYKEYPELYDYLEERGIAKSQMSLLSDLPAWDFPTRPEPVRATTSNVECPNNVEYPPVGPDTLNMNSGYSTIDFNVGDYVLVCNHDRTLGFDPCAPVGRVGRVVAIAGHDVGVNFSSGDIPFHDLVGRLRTRTGYFIRPYHLRPIEQPVGLHIWAPCDREGANEEVFNAPTPAPV